MNFDAVEAGGDGRAGRVAIVGDDPRQLVFAQGTGRRDLNKAVLGEGLAVRCACRRRNRRLPVRLQGDVRNAAHVPELHDDRSSFRMHRVGDVAPTRDLLVAVEAGRVEIALAFGADLGGLGDDQAGRGELRIVGRHDRRRPLSWPARSRVSGAMTMRLRRIRSPALAGSNKVGISRFRQAKTLGPTGTTPFVPAYDFRLCSRWPQEARRGSAVGLLH